MKNARWKILAGLCWGLNGYAVYHSEWYWNTFLAPIWWIMPLSALALWGWIALPVIFARKDNDSVVAPDLDFFRRLDREKKK